MNQVTLIESPKYVGYFDMYGILMHKEKKPSWIKRFSMKHFLGIVWHDLPNGDE